MIKKCKKKKKPKVSVFWENGWRTCRSRALIIWCCDLLYTLVWKGGCCLYMLWGTTEDFKPQIALI